MVTDLAQLEPPALATRIFGSRLDLAMRYVGWLAGAGVERGLVGPRETERVWDRHVLNCVCVSALIAPGSSVVDIGSGAGLPGLVLAIARPDLNITLVESMLRRATFLDEVITDLGLSGVTVRRGRAEELRTARLTADVVTARAVAPMDRLVRWAAPLMGESAELVALKGDGVVGEVAHAVAQLRSARLNAGRLLSVREAGPGEGAVAFAPGLLVEARGDWDLGATDGVADFRPAAGAEAHHSGEAVDADRLALVARFHRSGNGPSRVSRPDVSVV